VVCACLDLCTSGPLRTVRVRGAGSGAVSCARPGDIGSLREIWQDAALYVPPDEVAALDEAVQNLISDKTKRSRMAGKALARARRFSASRMAAGYLRAYGEATAWRRACAS
jgi:hypothetical protein